jgi:hypothetical protein
LRLTAVTRVRIRIVCIWAAHLLFENMDCMLLLLLLLVVEGSGKRDKRQASVSLVCQSRRTVMYYVLDTLFEDMDSPFPW